MKLQDLSDDQLLVAMEKIAQGERALLTQALHHLREVERRRLFSKLGFKSLFDYAVKKLLYSEDQAYRRISAMRLLQEIPELEQKLNQGLMSLSNVGLAQRYFREERKTRVIPLSEKTAVLTKLENLSTRQAEKVVATISSSPLTSQVDKIRTLTEELSEIKFTADQALLDKIEKLKGLLAHQMPQATLLELFHKLCDLGLQTWSPIKQTLPLPKETRVAIKQACKHQEQNCVHQNPAFTPMSSTVAPQKQRGMKISLRKQVWLKHQSRCCNCNSTYALQIDHIIPKAKGGETRLENLRLLCRPCNQRAAIEHFGLRKMDNFLHGRSRV